MTNDDAQQPAPGRGKVLEARARAERKPPISCIASGRLIPAGLALLLPTF